MAAIKNIIFDYGGVIIDLDYGRTRKAFEDLGVTDFDKHFTMLQQSTLFDDLDKGKISADQFRKGLNTELGTHFSDEEIDDGWNALLLGIRKEKFDILEEAHRRFRTFLLSNTNVIHIAKIKSYLEQTYGISNLSSYFDRIYYSCDMGMRKPDAEIFLTVMNENSLLAEETLFIDDGAQHIEAAKKIGLQTYLFKPGEDLLKVIESHR